MRENSIPNSNVTYNGAGIRAIKPDEARFEGERLVEIFIAHVD
jgi:hypothetical protein